MIAAVTAIQNFTLLIDTASAFWGVKENSASAANVNAPNSTHKCTRKKPLVTSRDDVTAIATATPNVKRNRKSARRAENTALPALAVNQLHHFRPAGQI
jgi:hypothetical protein